MPVPDKPSVRPQAANLDAGAHPGAPHDLLTLAEAAELLGYPGEVVLEHAHRGLLIGAVHILDQWRFLAGPIRDFIERHGPGHGLDHLI